MESLSFSEANADLETVMDRVVAGRAPIAIKRRRGKGVVLISSSEWSSMEETFYLLQSPANGRALLEAIRRLDAGEGEEHELIEPIAPLSRREREARGPSIGQQP